MIGFEVDTAGGTKNTAGEVIFRGVSVGGGGVVLGRIRILGSDDTGDRGEAVILCIVDRSSENELIYSGCGILIMGAIVSVEAISPRLLEFFAKKGIPYLIVKNGFWGNYSGRVALLDTDRDVLVVDPDVDTLSIYSVKRALVEAKPSISSSTSSDRGYIIEKNEAGVLINANTLSEEGELYGRLTDISESFCGAHITVYLAVPKNERDMGCFGSIVESIYRAAVYGSFSICLRGYENEDDIREAQKEMHRAFCRLEEQGREFNGYVRRGLVIESPIWLFRRSPFIKAETVCFELGGITAGLLGCRREQITEKAMQDEAMIKVWEQYVSRFCTESRRILCLGGIKDGELTQKIGSMIMADEVYINSILL